ncbi:endomucin [Indicator indicator]|uniref:endomucin n=1 Tax=Indicator indicator TaxID=1002788 RepID=UPI0023E03672|nr:endomucin [Indicator indicator]
MKLLGIAFFLLAVFCACTVGEDVVSTSTVTTTTFAPTLKPATEAVDPAISQTPPLQTSVLTTAVRATTEPPTTTSTPPSPNATQKTTQGTTTNPPAKETTTAPEKSDSPTNTTQASGTQLAYNESLDASSTKGSSFSSTVSLQNPTSAPGTSGLHTSSLTQSTNLDIGIPGSSSGNSNVADKDSHYSSIILPVVITLIVITLSVFSLVALYRMCQKKAPERQENGTEQTQSDKEGVKLLSVKTTSSETGEHSSQGKNKTRQLFTPQQ